MPCSVGSCKLFSDLPTLLIYGCDSWDHWPKKADTSLTPVPPNHRREAWKMRTSLKFDSEGFLTLSTRAAVRLQLLWISDGEVGRTCVTFASEWHGDAEWQSSQRGGVGWGHPPGRESLWDKRWEAWERRIKTPFVIFGSYAYISSTGTTYSWPST